MSANALCARAPNEPNMSKAVALRSMHCTYGLPLILLMDCTPRQLAVPTQVASTQKPEEAASSVHS